MNQYAGTYVNVGLNTTTGPERLLLMTYEGAIRFVSQARQMMVEGDKVGKAERLSRVTAIIEALALSLDKEKGGEVTENLASMYEYIGLQVTKANLYNDPGILDEVLGLLTTLYDGWSGAIRQLAAQQSEQASVTEEPASNAGVRRPLAVVG